MKLIGSELIRSWRRCIFLSPRVYDGVLCFYSTSRSGTAPSSSSSGNNDVSSLYRRISLAGDPRASMTAILDQWVQEGNEIYPSHLPFLVTRLRNFKRFSHALQVSKWMKEKYSSSMSPKDTAGHLELISKVHGLQVAEKYFNDLPHSSRTRVVLYALLNCYATSKSIRKAEGLMQKMKKLGFATNVVPYNIMLKIYLRLDMYDKVKQVIQEMENMGISWDAITYQILLSASSTAGKVDELERMLMKMEADPEHIMRHTDYVTAANGYLKAGVIDKSIIMLKRAEHLANDKAKKHVYQCLLTLYAHAKAKEDVFRIWNLYKGSWNVYNKGYLCMVSALVRLNDLEEAEKILDEWLGSLSSDKELDVRIVNSLIRAYGNKGDLERAEALIDRVRKLSGREPRRSTWDTLAAGYQMHNHMENAVLTMKKALLADAETWVLNKKSLMRCMEYLIMKRNPEELEEFTGLLKKCGYDEKELLFGKSEDAEGKHANDQDVGDVNVEPNGIIV